MFFFLTKSLNIIIVISYVLDICVILTYLKIIESVQLKFLFIFVANVYICICPVV